MENLYQQQLAKIILYGSQARGNAQADSDVNILVVLKTASHFFSEIKKISQLITKLYLKFDAVISCNFSTLGKPENYNNNYYRKIRKEGREV